MSNYRAIEDDLKGWAGRGCERTQPNFKCVCWWFEIRNADLEGKKPLGRPRRRWEDNIKMDLREVEGGGDWSWLRIRTDGGHLWIRWWTYWFHKVRGISWLAVEPVSFSRRTLLHGVSKNSGTGTVSNRRTAVFADWSCSEKYFSYCSQNIRHNDNNASTWSTTSRPHTMKWQIRYLQAELFPWACPSRLGSHTTAETALGRSGMECCGKGTRCPSLISSFRGPASQRTNVRGGAVRDALPAFLGLPRLPASQANCSTSQLWLPLCISALLYLYLHIFGLTCSKQTSS